MRTCLPPRLPQGPPHFAPRFPSSRILLPLALAAFFYISFPLFPCLASSLRASPRIRAKHSIGTTHAPRAVCTAHMAREETKE